MTGAQLIINNFTTEKIYVLVCLQNYRAFSIFGVPNAQIILFVYKQLILITTYLTNKRIALFFMQWPNALNINIVNAINDLTYLYVKTTMELVCSRSEKVLPQKVVHRANFGESKLNQYMVYYLYSQKEPRV